jgi:dTDP-4-amino-4,6-dideoxygalactose transaminase
MDPIHVISEKYSLDVIEDAAQAIGAEYLTAHMGLRKAGTMGEAGCFSFIHPKISVLPAMLG